MTENIHWELKMELLHYNCFPAITKKLIVGWRNASKSSGNVVIVVKDSDVMMLLLYSYSMCAMSKEWVLKYDTNNYANIGLICKYLGNTVGRNILQYHAITGCDTTWFFYRIGKISSFKEVPKKSSPWVTQVLKIVWYF